MEEAIVNINDTEEDVDVRDILVKENSQLLLIHPTRDGAKRCIIIRRTKKEICLCF